MKGNNREDSSFRDPAGYVFYSEGNVYRKINEEYLDNYNKLMDSGLFDELRDKDLIIKHKETSKSSKGKIIKLEELDFISYPYEWSFSQLRDAAILTLKIEKIANKYNMSLKDANAYNIQFKNQKPVFIDTVSFEDQKEEPWKAYKEFCRHFLAPLAIRKYTDRRLGKLMRCYINGVPLGLASKILPKKTYAYPNILAHIHIHSKINSGNKNRQNYRREMSQKMLSGFKSNLRSAIPDTREKKHGKHLDPKKSLDNTSYRKSLLKNFIQDLNVRESWIINLGNIEIEKIVSKTTRNQTVSITDEYCINECMYRNKDLDVLHIVQSLENPSPDNGWLNKERKSLFERGNPELGIALNLTDELAFSKGIPLEEQSKLFEKLFEKIVVEFVPKKESDIAKRLNKEIIAGFKQYNHSKFKKEFRKGFKIVKSANVGSSKREIYLMERKNSNQ